MQSRQIKWVSVIHDLLFFVEVVSRIANAIIAIALTENAMIFFIIFMLHPVVFIAIGPISVTFK